jgi:hypothetical protein
LAPELHGKLTDVVAAHLPELDAKLRAVMQETAGPGVLELLEEAFGADEAGRAYGMNWYYGHIPSLQGKRPYDLCKAGRSEVVANTLGMFIHGMY